MTLPLARELALRPLHDDPKDLGIENGAHIWGSSTNDPAFIASPPGGELLEAGWYRASARLDCRSGDIHEPQIYIPAAEGHFSEERSVKMIRNGAAYSAEFFLPHAASHVRLDPSRNPCEFACNSLQLTPIQGRARPRGDSAAAAPRSGPAQWLRRWSRAGLRRMAAPKRAPVPARPPDRKERVLKTIDKNGIGLEIGPSHDPIAPKREGYKVHVIDHANRDELLVKYEKHGMPLDRIEEVDFVWRGESYLELTGKPNHYDWIIASHLIEHTPDLIAFLADCDAILKDGGVLSLVIPDKRYVFDRFRPITGLARIIDAHFAGNKIHSAGAAAEYFLNVASKAHQLGWSEGSEGGYTFIHSADYARQMIREVREKGSYLDIHNWCFVPHSFRLLLNDLHALGFTRLREVDFHGTEGCEFYVTLGRHGTGPNMSRLEILAAIDTELAPD
jgi:SAM-dependent methyltransferase